MALLTERQLMLLNELAYIEGSFYDKTQPLSKILVDLKKDVQSGTATLHALLTKEEALKTIKAILDDPILKNYKIVESKNDNISTAIFKDTGDYGKNDNVLIIRGTAGDRLTWHDNFGNILKAETNLASKMNTYYAEISKKYNITQVSGHSRGGNEAQRFTIKYGNNVEQCISFNGQGFTDEFIKNNKALINKNSYKIKSISSYKDPINLCLTPIAKTIEYIKTDDGKGNSHKSSPLTDERLYDKSGKFKGNCKTKYPDEMAKALANLLNSTLNLKESEKKLAYDLAVKIADIFLVDNMTQTQKTLAIAQIPLIWQKIKLLTPILLANSKGRDALGTLVATLVANGYLKTEEKVKEYLDNFNNLWNKIRKISLLEENLKSNDEKIKDIRKNLDEKTGEWKNYINKYDDVKLAMGDFKNNKEIYNKYQESNVLLKGVYYLQNKYEIEKYKEAENHLKENNPKILVEKIKEIQKDSLEKEKEIKKISDENVNMLSEIQICMNEINKEKPLETALENTHLREEKTIGMTIA